MNKKSGSKWLSLATTAINGGCNGLVKTTDRLTSIDEQPSNRKITYQMTQNFVSHYLLANFINSKTMQNSNKLAYDLTKTPMHFMLVHHIRRNNHHY